jgi:hypothetical protein
VSLNDGILGPVAYAGLSRVGRQLLKTPAWPPNHGKEIIDLLLRAENRAFERGAVAFGAAQLQVPDLSHVAVAGTDLRRLDQGTVAAGCAGDAEREAGEGKAVEILDAHSDRTPNVRPDRRAPGAFVAPISVDAESNLAQRQRNSTRAETPRQPGSQIP